MRRSRGSKDDSKRGATFSPARIATRVAELGRQISRACDGKRLDVVITLDRGFVFGADLIRNIDAPTVCHFIREDVRDVEQVLRSLGYTAVSDHLKKIIRHLSLRPPKQWPCLTAPQHDEIADQSWRRRHAPARH